MLNQKSQKAASGHIEGGGICHCQCPMIVPDSDFEWWIVVIDILLTSHRGQECQGIGLKRGFHGPSVQGDAGSSRPVAHHIIRVSPQPNIPDRRQPRTTLVWRCHGRNHLFRTGPGFFLHFPPFTRLQVEVPYVGVKQTRISNAMCQCHWH